MVETFDLQCARVPSEWLLAKCGQVIAGLAVVTIVPRERHSLRAVET